MNRAMAAPACTGNASTVPGAATGGSAVMAGRAAADRATAAAGSLAPRVFAQGFGLVELMVSLAIGALLALAASGMLLGANAAYQRQGDSTRLDDSGRQALAIMARAIRQAGYAPPAAASADAPALPLAAIMGLDGAGIAQDRYGIDGPWPGAVNGSDVLAVRFSGSGSGDGDGSITDCAGFAVAADDDGWSIFYVAAGPDGLGELRCKYKGNDGWGADAVVRGVDTLQILYGVDTDEPADGVPNRYLNATDVAALDAGGKAWRRVASVRIALLLQGGRQAVPAAATGAAPATYHLFGSGYTALAGRRDTGVFIDERGLPAAQRQRLRRVVGATVFVGNAGGG